MRIIQVTEEEKTTEQYNREAIRGLRNSLIFERAVAEDDVNENASAEQCAMSDEQLTQAMESATANNDDAMPDDERLLGESLHGVSLMDERAYDDEDTITQPDLLSLSLHDGDTVKTMDQWNMELSAEENAEEESQTIETSASGRVPKFHGKTIAADEGEHRDEVDHHDSDTESFYNIWGDDDEWLYGNNLRNVVRNLHRCDDVR